MSYQPKNANGQATMANSGPVVIGTGKVISGSGSVRGGVGGKIDFRSTLTLSQINALTANQLPISIVCTSVSGNSLIRAGMGWYEQTT